MTALIGFAFVIGGIAWVLIVVGVHTIMMISIVIHAGGVILTGVTRTLSKDNPGLAQAIPQIDATRAETIYRLTCLSVQAKACPPIMETSA